MGGAVRNAMREGRASTLGAAPGPTIPPAWSAKVNQTNYINGVKQTTIVPVDHTVLVSNSLSKRTASFSPSKFAWAPQAFVGTPSEFMNFTQLFTEDTMDFILNGQKLDGSVYKGKYFDYFSWLAVAKDGGPATFNGTACRKWTFSSAIAHAAFELLVTAAGGTPVFLSMNTSWAGPGGGFYLQQIVFHEFRSDESLLPHVWDGYNQTDYTHPAPCPKPSGPLAVDTEIFVFHPKNEFNLTQQDVGDATGDVFFVCVDVLTNQATAIDHHYAWISSWTLHHNAQLGQYQNCNGYPPTCLGAENFLVGHEAAQGLAPHGGQCQANPLTGEWWSLPAGGRCAQGETPEGGKCTWSATRKKTIDSKCLLDLHGFKEACAAGGRAPFAAASKIFTQALAEDDVAKGGCPPLNVSSASSELHLSS